MDPAGSVMVLSAALGPRPNMRMLTADEENQLLPLLAQINNGTLVPSVIPDTNTTGTGTGAGTGTGTGATSGVPTRSWTRDGQTYTGRKPRDEVVRNALVTLAIVILLFATLIGMFILLTVSASTNATYSITDPLSHRSHRVELQMVLLAVLLAILQVIWMRYKWPWPVFVFFAGLVMCGWLMPLEWHWPRQIFSCYIPLAVGYLVMYILWTKFFDEVAGDV